MSTTPPAMPGAPAKKTSPLVWILGGIVVLMMGAMITCGVVGYMAVRAVKNAGFDPELMQKNPGLAIAKMAASLHPDMEVVSTNERTGKIVMRDKSSGKVVTMKFDPDKKTLVVVGDDGKDVTFSASGDSANGSLTVQSAEGTVKFGAAAGAKPPSWVPMYAGVTTEGAYSSETPQGSQITFTFKTADAASKVITFYEESFKTSGFTVTQVVNSGQGGMLTAEDADKKHTVVVTVGSSGDGTQGSIMAVEKK